MKTIEPTVEPIMRVGPKHQITLPVKIFEELELEQGDFLSARIENNEIVLKPQKLIPRNQEWFWTKEWQEKEKEADGDIKTGRLSGPFTSAQELKKHLDGLKRKKRN